MPGTSARFSISPRGGPSYYEAASTLGIPLGTLPIRRLAIGIMVFVGLTAWDAQRIKEECAENAGGEELQK